MHSIGLVSALMEQGLSTIHPKIPDDLFVACASFEPRSSALTECMGKQYRAKRSALYVNSEFLEIGHTADQVAIMERNLSLASDRFAGVYRGSWEDAANQFKTLKELIAPEGINSERFRITVDITTFNREALTSTLGLIRWAYPASTLRLVYVSPDEYNPQGRAELLKQGQGSIDSLDPAKVQERIWLSRGFRKLRNAIGFSGFQNPTRPSLLVLLPGFEIERPLTIVDNVEPSIVYLGRPIDSTRDKFYERSLESKNQMFRLFKARQPVVEFDFSCRTVGKTLEALTRIVEENHKSHNIFVTSLSTKPTLIATLLLAERFDYVQITSSVPGEYNIGDYSSGAHEVSAFEMPHKVG